VFVEPVRVRILTVAVPVEPPTRLMMISIFPAPSLTEYFEEESSKLPAFAKASVLVSTNGKNNNPAAANSFPNFCIFIFSSFLFF